MEVDHNRISLAALQLPLLFIFLGDVEVQSEFPFEWGNGRFNVAMEGRMFGARSREPVEHHANAHEDAPELRLNVQHPSWAVSRLRWSLCSFVVAHCRGELNWVSL